MMKTRSKQPLVLDYVINQKEGIENIEKFFDSSDMTAFEYFVDGNKYYYECIHSYLDLEYYHNQDDTDKNKRLFI